MMHLRSAFINLGLAACALLLTACSQKKLQIEPKAGELKNISAADAESRAEVVRADPLAYIQQVAENARKLEQYTVLFTRVERRGLFNTRYGPERISCWFRREPFSIRMKWLDPDVKYGESVYVANQHDGKVRFVSRKGFMGLPPGITTVDLQTPVTWGESRYPLSDFGLERNMRRTLDAIAEAGDGVTIRYEGLRTAGETDTPAHHLRLEYTNLKGRPPVNDLYVDVRSDLPVATILKERNDDIVAAYFYESLNTEVQLTDEDFLLDAERGARK